MDYQSAPTGSRTMRVIRARRPASHGPSPGILAAIVACFLLPISLIPSSKGFFFSLPFLPRAWWKTNLVVLFCMLLIALRPFLGYSRERSRPTRWWFLWPLLLLSGWQIVSLTWNDRDGVMKSYALLQSVAMAAAILSSVLLASGMSFTRRMALGRSTTIVLAMIFVVYLGLSFIFPSLRPSFENIDRMDTSLGFNWMFGPLGKATTLLFILLPTLGFCMGMIAVPGRSRLFWIAMSLFFLLSTLATGSRGALVCLGMFGLCLLASLRLRAGSRGSWSCSPTLRG